MKTDATKLLRLIGLALLILLSVGLVACGGAAGEPASQGARSDMVEAEMPAAPQPTMVADYDNGTSPDLEDVPQAQQARVIIYTGDMTLVVQDTRQSIQAITGLAQEQGGYVSGSQVYQSGEVPRGNITIRVPAEQYQATLEALRALAVRVERENTSSQDVTAEFVDLQARKTNLEFTEQALQELLEERQQVGRTSDILEVYRELTNIRSQIEQIEGRLRYLSNQAALSTISVELVPDVLYQPVSIGGWEPRGVAKEALQALVAALQGLINLLIWLIILVLPLLLIFLVPVIVVIWIVRRLWKRRKARQKKAAPQPEQEPAAKQE